MLTNIKILGQLPKSDMPRLWSVSCASLVLLRKLDLFLTVIPSKIFEGMAMKKPIIMGVDGESREIVKEAGAGVFIEPESAEDLAREVQRLADSSELCERLGNSGHQHVTKHFDRQVLATQYEEILSSVRFNP